MNLTRTSGRRTLFMDFHHNSGLIVLAVLSLCWSASCFGQSPQETPAPVAQKPGSEPSGPDQKAFGSISGTVLDQTGAVLAGARVSLTTTGENQSSEAQSPKQEALSGEDGQFSFAS